jgi:hypothetical protein
MEGGNIGTCFGRQSTEEEEIKETGTGRKSIRKESE